MLSAGRIVGPAARREREGNGIGVFVITGPSGVGKSTLVARLREWKPELFWSVSVTTRARRPNEVDGVHYHFCADEEFDDLLRRGELLEWAAIYGHRSGTPRAPLEQAVAQGRDVLLDVDVRGARAIKGEIPDAVVIFLTVSSPDELRRRLILRDTETPQALADRLSKAEAVMGTAGEFEHVVANDDLEQAWRQIADIITRSTRDPV